MIKDCSIPAINIVKRQIFTLGDCRLTKNKAYVLYLMAVISNETDFEISDAVKF